MSPNDSKNPKTTWLAVGSKTENPKPQTLTPKPINLMSSGPNNQQPTTNNKKKKENWKKDKKVVDTREGNVILSYTSLIQRPAKLSKVSA